MEYVIYQGQLLARDKAAISLDDRGFRYGDGLFETIRVAQNRLYQWDFHLSRLQAGLAAIRINAKTDGLYAACMELIAANHVTDGLIRLQITRGCGERGYLPDANATPTILIETAALPAAPAEPVSLWLSGYEKTSAAALPVVHKLSQGLNSTLARMEAADHGCADAVLLNAKGEVCETASANIFWLENGVWHTPALACGVLNGSTRAALIRLAGAKEAVATIDRIAAAQTVILCNAALGVVAVNALLPLDLSWDSGLHAQTLSDLYRRDIRTSS